MFIPQADDLVGTPFEYGGRGPDSYDCYGLVKEIYKREGVELPDFIYSKDVADDPLRYSFFEALMGGGKSSWTRIKGPKLGSVVHLQVFGYGCHIGVVSKYNRFYHAWQLSGGVTQERLEPWKRRVLGYYKYDGK